MSCVNEITNKLISNLIEASKYHLDNPFTFRAPKESVSTLYYWQGCGSNVITWLDNKVPKGDSIKFSDMRKRLDSGLYVKN